MPANSHSDYLSILPSRWEQLPIREIGRVYAGGTPRRANPSYWDGSIPWVTPSELTVLRTKEITKTRESITESGLAECSATLLPIGSLIVTTRATIGNVAVAGVPLCTNQGFKNIVLAGETDPDFYYHLIKLISSEFVRLASGTTFLEVSARDFASVVVPRPSLAEQHRIAEVLDTVDHAIQHTQHMITKLKAVRAGMLHDLLTCGLDEQGQLRDPQARSVHLIDMTTGRVPKGWSIKSIGEIADVTKLAGFEFTHVMKYEDEGEIIALRALNIKDERLDLSDVQRIGRKISDRLSRSKIFRGDILITYIGAYIGDVLLIEEDDKYHLAPNIAKITVHSGVNAGFLQWILRSTFVRTQIRRLTTVTATPSLTMTQIRNIRVALPNDLAEQERIEAYMATHDRRVRVEEVALTKLYSIRYGLMNDLLAGRIRA